MQGKAYVLLAVKQNGLALRYADASLKSDKEVVIEAVKQNGVALRFAHASLKSDKEVVVEAVKQHGYALYYADDSLKSDFEVQLAAVRHSSPTSALKMVRQLSKIPGWKEMDRLLTLAVELLSYFPDSSTAPKVNKQLHITVEGIVKRAYKPGKRGREAYEQEVFVN